MALRDAGDVVAVDAPTYPGLKRAAEVNRLELVPLPAAGSGLDPNSLAALCKRRRVRAVYTMPALHNPPAGSSARLVAARLSPFHGATA